MHGVRVQGRPHPHALRRRQQPHPRPHRPHRPARRRHRRPAAPRRDSLRRAPAPTQLCTSSRALPRGSRALPSPSTGARLRRGGARLRRATRRLATCGAARVCSVSCACLGRPSPSHALPTSACERVVRAWGCACDGAKGFRDAGTRQDTEKPRHREASPSFKGSPT